LTGLRVLPAVRSMACENWLLQGFARMDRQLADAGALAGHLVPGRIFAFLAERRGELFPDEDHADLFAPAGKAS
jgi:hypothetical protein